MFKTDLAWDDEDYNPTAFGKEIIKLDIALKGKEIAARGYSGVEVSPEYRGSIVEEADSDKTMAQLGMLQYAYYGEVYGLDDAPENVQAAVNKCKDAISNIHPDKVKHIETTDEQGRPVDGGIDWFKPPVSNALGEIQEAFDLV